jgi:hypothetical protein
MSDTKLVTFWFTKRLTGQKTQRSMANKRGASQTRVKSSAKPTRRRSLFAVNIFSVKQSLPVFWFCVSPP